MTGKRDTTSNIILWCTGARCSNVTNYASLLTYTHTNTHSQGKKWAKSLPQMLAFLLPLALNFCRFREVHHFLRAGIINFVLLCVCALHTMFFLFPIASGRCIFLSTTTRYTPYTAMHIPCVSVWLSVYFALHRKYALILLLFPCAPVTCLLFPALFSRLLRVKHLRWHMGHILA